MGKLESSKHLPTLALLHCLLKSIVVNAQSQVTRENTIDGGTDDKNESQKETAKTIAYIVIVIMIVLVLALIVLVTRFCTLYGVHKNHFSLYSSKSLRYSTSGSSSTSIESGPVSTVTSKKKRQVRIHAADVEDDSDEEQPPLPPKKASSTKLKTPASGEQQRPLLFACWRI